MFCTGFQSFAFQSAGGVSVVTAISGDDRFTYVSHYQIYQKEEAAREKLRKQKSELEKLQSVLRETERKRALAAESKALADKRNALRLAKLEQEFIEEINRLLVVRADLMRRARQSEETLIIMMAMKRKRLRAVNWQSQLAIAQS